VEAEAAEGERERGMEAKATRGEGAKGAEDLPDTGPAKVTVLTSE